MENILIKKKIMNSLLHKALKKLKYVDRHDTNEFHLKDLVKLNILTTA